MRNKCPKRSNNLMLRCATNVRKGHCLLLSLKMFISNFLKPALHSHVRLLGLVWQKKNCKARFLLKIGHGRPLSLSLSLSHSLNKWPCNLSQNFIKNHIFLGSAFSFSFYPSLCLSICPYLWLLISNALSFKYIFPISVQCWHRMPNYPQLLSLFVLSVIFFPVFLCMIFQY